MSQKIGTFTKQNDGRFRGSINTLTLRGTVDIVPVDLPGENTPDFRVYTRGGEIGAAWTKTARASDQPYLSVKIDDPSLPAPIFCRLVELVDQGQAAHALFWSR